MVSARFETRGKEVVIRLLTASALMLNWISGWYNHAESDRAADDELFGLPKR